MYEHGLVGENGIHVHTPTLMKQYGVIMKKSGKGLFQILKGCLMNSRLLVLMITFF